jgi:DNA-binding transcriptional regulator LsrR (DeoR family)
MAARIAGLFYMDGWSKVQIADQLGLTRFKVARLIQLARASGMVRITVVGAGSLDLMLSERLCHQFGLRHAVVVSTTTGDDHEIRAQIGAAAANLLSEIMTPDDVLESAGPEWFSPWPPSCAACEPYAWCSSPAP